MRKAARQAKAATTSKLEVRLKDGVELAFDREWNSSRLVSVMLVGLVPARTERADLRSCRVVGQTCALTTIDGMGLLTYLATCCVSI